jgi:hypothetical protein
MASIEHGSSYYLLALVLKLDVSSVLHSTTSKSSLPTHSRRMMALQVSMMYKAYCCTRSTRTCSHTIDNSRQPFAHRCYPLLNALASSPAQLGDPTRTPPGPASPPALSQPRPRSPGFRPRMLGAVRSRPLFFCPIDTSVRARVTKCVYLCP